MVKRLQDLISVKENLSRLFEYIENVKVDINPILTSNDINIDEILNFKYNHQIIEIKIKQIESRIKIINKEFEEENENIIQELYNEQTTIESSTRDVKNPIIKRRYVDINDVNNTDNFFSVIIPIYSNLYPRAVISSASCKQLRVLLSLTLKFLIP